MIQIYGIEDDRLSQITVAPGEALPTNVLWIDLLHPSEEEKEAVKAWTGISVPDDEEMREIEESSRFFMEGGVQYLTAPILQGDGHDHRRLAPISFVLTESHLITVRYSDPKAISLYASRATKPGSGQIDPDHNKMSVLLGLLEAATDGLADTLENVAGEIENASHGIFYSSSSRPLSTREFRHTLTRIGSQGSLLSKVRESLSGLSRLLAYVTFSAQAEEGHKEGNKEIDTRIQSLERDTQSLEAYVDFLSNKTTFLLDTIVGLISVEQNAIIKIFSVAAVGLMPPTLVASIYGMNFHFMPELDQPWGYPVALGVMVISAILPLLYFRKKGWL